MGWGGKEEGWGVGGGMGGEGGVQRQCVYGISHLWDACIDCIVLSQYMLGHTKMSHCDSN